MSSTRLGHASSLRYLDGMRSFPWCGCFAVPVRDYAAPCSPSVACCSWWDDACRAPWPESAIMSPSPLSRALGRAPPPPPAAYYWCVSFMVELHCLNGRNRKSVHSPHVYWRRRCGGSRGLPAAIFFFQRPPSLVEAVQPEAIHAVGRSIAPQAMLRARVSHTFEPFNSPGAPVIPTLHASL